MAISVRNNNPGALMYASWEKAYGAVPGGKNVAGTLARFPTPAQGYAAAAQWHRRAEARGMTTLRQRMSVYAPANGAGNSKASFNAYLNKLANSMGITPDTPFSIDDPNLGPKLLLAHAQFESGMQNPFPDGALEQGYAMGPGQLPPAMAESAQSPERVLRKGDVGGDVAALQYRLASVGLYNGPIDGKFGPQTAEAVRAVQRNANLHLDSGIAGPEVYAALANAGTSVFAAANGPAAAAPVSTAEYGFGSPLASGSFAGPQLAQAGTASAASAPVQLAQSGGANRLAQTGLFSQAPQVAFGGGAVGARAPVQLAQGGRAGGIFEAPQVAQSGGAGSAFRQPTPQLANAGGASGQRATTQVAMSPTLRTKDDAFSPASSGSTRVVSAFSTRAPDLGSAGSAGSAVRATSIAASPQASVQRVSYTPAVTRLVSPAAAYNASPAPVGMAMSALGGAEKTQSINPFGTKLANLGAAAEAVAPQQTVVRRVVTAPAAVTYKTVQPNLVPQASLMPQAPAKKEMPNGLFGKIMQNLPVAKAVNGLGNLVSPFNTGAAVDYGMVQPKTNAFAVSPFTPVGFNTPDFTPKSGGAVYAYQTSAPGVGSYINSAGRTMSYNVNADQRVYGNYSGGFGGFQP